MDIVLKYEGVFPRNYSGKVPLFIRKFPEKFRRKFPEISELTTLIMYAHLALRYLTQNVRVNDCSVHDTGVIAV